MDDSSDLAHLSFHHSSRSNCRGSDSQTAGLKWATSFSGNSVPVKSNIGSLQGNLSLLAGEVGMGWSQVKKHQVVVASSADEVKAPFVE